MISLSTISFIIIIQLILLLLLLFVIWFFKHRYVSNKLNTKNSRIEDLEQQMTELLNRKTTTDIIDDELKYNRQAIDDHYSDSNTLDIAETFEFRSAYLQLEKKWLLNENKNENYWQEIYQQLKELFIDAVVLNKRFSDDGVSGELKKRSDETTTDDNDVDVSAAKDNDTNPTTENAPEE